MGKYIGIKMIEATPMKASMALEHGYKIGNHNADDLGVEYHDDKVAVVVEE